MEKLIAQWREENLLSEGKQNEIRLAALKDVTLTVDWWKSVMAIPKTAFWNQAA